MSLAEIWGRTPEQLRDKLIQQIISFAGDGKLRDDSKSSQEFRESRNTFTAHWSNSPA